MVELHTAEHLRLTLLRGSGGRLVRTFRSPHSERCPDCGAELSIYNGELRCSVCFRKAIMAQPVEPGDPALPAHLLHSLLVAYPRPADPVRELNLDPKLVERTMRKLRRQGHNIVGVRPRGYLYVVNGFSHG